MMAARWKEPVYHGEARTRLERFVRARGLFPARIARASQISRNRLILYRTGEASPTLPTIRRLVRGVRKVTKDPAVTANDLFPLDDDDG